jgi:NADH-quinone oxidoreductase subunit A
LEGSTGYLDGLTPFLFYFAAVLAVVVTMLGLSFFLGQRKTSHSKDLPFESGIVSVGSAHFRISVHFYLPAILFIIFDLEVVFLFAWAVAVKEAGWPGFIEISVFIFILIAALFYLWRIGALDWRTQTQKREVKTLAGPGGVVNKKEFKL